MRRGRIRSAINLFLKEMQNYRTVWYFWWNCCEPRTQDDNNKWWFIISNSLINHHSWHKTITDNNMGMREWNEMRSRSVVVETMDKHPRKNQVQMRTEKRNSHGGYTDWKRMNEWRSMPKIVQLICNNIDHQLFSRCEALMLSWSAKKVFVECRV